MSLISSVLCESESIPMQGGFATSTQIDPGSSQQGSEASTSEAPDSCIQKRNLDHNEETSDEEQDGDISGSITSSKNDAARHNSKCVGEIPLGICLLSKLNSFII